MKEYEKEEGKKTTIKQQLDTFKYAVYESGI